MGNYALKSSIPDVSSFVTNSALNTKLNSYATQSWVNSNALKATTSSFIMSDAQGAGASWTCGLYKIGPMVIAYKKGTAETGSFGWYEGTVPTGFRPSDGWCISFLYLGSSGNYLNGIQFLDTSYSKLRMTKGAYSYSLKVWYGMWFVF